MNPIELVHRLVERTGESQKNLALVWLEAWNRTAAKPLSITTAEPRFSNLMKDEREGWKFYFADPRRADLLLQVLHAEAGERAALVEAGAAKLSANAEARVVVDLHNLDGKVDAILDALVGDVLTDRSLVPVVVLVSPAQYGLIPMAFAEQVRLVQVKSDADASRELAERSVALVLAAAPPRDADSEGPAFTRWAAIAWEGGRFVIEPPDAVAVFVGDGRLGDIPVVPLAERIDALGVAPTEPPNRLVGPELRRRMLALAEGSFPAPPSERLGEAIAYGVVAASTDDERVRSALTGAGLPAESTVDQVGLDRALSRAALRPGAAAVLRVGSDWHLVNSDVPEPLRVHPGVRAHLFDARKTPLRRLADVAAIRTAVEWELDPHLRGAISALDPAGGDAASFAHARAWIIYGGHFATVAAAAVSDGPERLARLLNQPAPVSEVRISQFRGGEPSKDRPRIYSLRDPSILESSVWAQVPPVGDTLWHRREDRLVAASIGKGRPMAEFHPERHRDHFRTPKPASPWVGAVWEGRLLVPPDAPLDDDAWLDAIAERGLDAPMGRLRARHSVAAAIQRQQRETLEAQSDRHGFPRRHDGGSDGDEVVRTSLWVCGLPTPRWADLDLALTVAWHALRRAIQGGPALPVHDGRWLLPLSPGVIAELTFSGAPPDIACRAAFEQGADVDWSSRLGSHVGWSNTTLSANPSKSQVFGCALSPLFSQPFGWEPVGGQRLGPMLPAGLRILGAGMSCAIRFVTNPYALGECR